MAKRKKAAKKGSEELVRPTPIDGHVGARVRERRMLIGMRQETLADRLGISFQQLQKNEKGINRIASSRLLDLSKALDVPIQYFFDNMPKTIAASSTAEAHRVTDGIDDNADLMTKAETLKLVRAYYEIEDPRVRKRVYDLAKALGGDEA